jgi:hypothetical protein
VQRRDSLERRQLETPKRLTVSILHWMSICCRSDGRDRDAHRGLYVPRVQITRSSCCSGPRSTTSKQPGCAVFIVGGGGVFADLYQALCQGRASVESYSIKSLNPHRFTRAVPLRETNVALQSYGNLLSLGHSGRHPGYVDGCVAKLARQFEQQSDVARRASVRIPQPLTEAGDGNARSRYQGTRRTEHGHLKGARTSVLFELIEKIGSSGRTRTLTLRLTAQFGSSSDTKPSQLSTTKD